MLGTFGAWKTGNLAFGQLLLFSLRGGACSSAWLEPAAHNGLVAGSNPAGPTNTPFAPVREIVYFLVISIANTAPRFGSARWHRQICWYISREVPTLQGKVPTNSWKLAVPLTDAKLRSLKPQKVDFKLADGGGLHLLVRSTGGKLWRLSYRFNKKQKTLALGAYPAVSLLDARQARDLAKHIVSMRSSVPWTAVSTFAKPMAATSVVPLPPSVSV